MNGEAQPEKIKAGRFHFGLASLLWLQVVVTPIFLSPFYRSLAATSRHHPYSALIAMFLGPAIYVTLLALWPAQRQDSNRRPSLFVELRSGALYGLLFCILAFGPLGAVTITRLFLATDVPDAIQLIEVSVFLLLHHVIIGSAIGGGVGITKDLVAQYARRAQPRC